MINDVDIFVSNVSEEDLEKIEEYANKLMSIHDIAVLMRISPTMLSMTIKNDCNVVAEAYQRGKAKRVLDMHEREIELADTGSAQAMENLHGFLHKMDAGED